MPQRLPHPLTMTEKSKLFLRKVQGVPREVSHRHGQDPCLRDQRGRDRRPRPCGRRGGRVGVSADAWHRPWSIGQGGPFDRGRSLARGPRRVRWRRMASDWRAAFGSAASSFVYIALSGRSGVVGLCRPSMISRSPVYSFRVAVPREATGQSEEPALCSNTL